MIRTRRLDLPAFRSLDGAAVWLSALCLVHCLAGLVFAALLLPLGGAILNPVVHQVGLMLAVPLALFALIQGSVRHGALIPAAVGSLGIGAMMGAAELHGQAGEVAFTMVGVAIVALGHWMNYRALRLAAHPA